VTRTVDTAQQASEIDTQHMGQKNAGLAMRRIDARRAKHAGRALQRGVDRPRHASAAVKLARRAA
jgi:hypothetical protein